MTTQMDKKILGIITARGGSKGVLGKNIADFGGKPMLAWTIENALSSDCIDKLVLSTDDQAIADVAEIYGLSVPWLRPSELAQDDSPAISALIHAVKKVAEEDYHPDYIMLLQPNIPFRSSEDIKNAVKILFDKSADSVVSICKTDNHPYLCKKIDKDGQLNDFMEVPIPETQRNRQNLPPAYSLNGAVYVVKTEILLNKKSLYGDKTYAYIMPPERSIDIDTPWDMYLARLIMKDKLVGAYSKRF